MNASPTRTVLRRKALRYAGALSAAGLTGLLGAVAFGGCAQPPVTVPTRSLERSGRASFVCLAQPRSEDLTKDPVYPGQTRPITDCTTQQVLAVKNYLSDPEIGADLDKVIEAECVDGGGPNNKLTREERLPHLYSLVTQTTRGEVAVVDVTARDNPVLDQDPSVPGANFLPVGAQPVDIVSTPGGTASFVGVAEVGREGIFALPSSMIRPRSADPCSGAPEEPAPQISSWPACRLHAAPGQMLLINDPEVGDQVRTNCDGAYAVPPPAGDHGDLSLEGQGRQKLVVAIPDLGGIAVIDAQELLDRPAGSFDACPVQRWILLDNDVPHLPLPPPIMGSACVSPESVMPDYALAYEPRPTSITYASGRLYASDLAAPLVHVIDMPTPCEPVELPPLLPTSVTDPKRVITTTKVAVASALTPDLKRYLYAVDAEEGSAMVFDVSDNQASRFPISRRHPEWHPLEPPDRIRFAAPIADLTLVERDVPVTHPGTGVAPHGTRCDPDPTLPVCTPTTTTCPVATSGQTCNVAASYRTSANYDAGASPTKLRGEFALFALSTGKIAVIDIDDYDAKCRAPAQHAKLYGCDTEDPTDTDRRCSTSQELSCNIVLPNTPRLATYETYDTSATTARVPGIQTLPLLYDETGALVTTDPAATPQMVATIPDGSSNVYLALLVGSSVASLNRSNGKIESAEPSDKTRNVLVMNLEDPHAQLFDQNWFVTFEGALPGFGQHAGNVIPQSEISGEVVDPDSRFCDAGVLSEEAVREQLIARGDDPAKAPRLADYVQIANALAAQEDPSWNTANGCDYATCLAVFGATDAPLSGRDFRIIEAYQDRVALTARDPEKFYKDYPKNTVSVFPAPVSKGPENKPCTTTPECAPGLACISGICAEGPVQCCFPTLASFNVRAGGQWVVQGDVSGFLHHVIADPVTGVCRNSCDPRRVRENGRVAESPPGAVVTDGKPGAFINPMFRFAVLNGKKNDKPETPKRDLQFRFATLGSFVPLLVDLGVGVANVTNTTTNATATDRLLILPVGMTVVPATSELAVTDGSINGLILVNLSSVGVSKVFF